MLVKRICSDLLESNMYIVVESGHALIIDPCKNISMFDSDLKYDWILLTHEHYDHISGVNDWKRLTGARLMCSKECAESISSSKKNMSRYFSAFCEMQSFSTDIPHYPVKEFTCNADEIFEISSEVDWMGHTLKLIHCPGHSKGSILIYFDNEAVFSGDSILQGKNTECRFPGGSIKAWESIGKPLVEKIKDDMIVYPGHFEEFYYKDREINRCTD